MWDGKEGAEGGDDEAEVGTREEALNRDVDREGERDRDREEDSIKTWRKKTMIITKSGRGLPVKQILRMPGTEGKVPRDNKKRNDVFTLHSFRTTPRLVRLIAIITRNKREKKERVTRDEHREGYERKKEEERRKRKKKHKCG